MRSFDEKSLAYSWEIGDYHFVQLHLRPEYTVTDKRVGVASSIPWLTQDVADADRRGKKIVVNFHDAAGARTAGFLGAIRGRRVVAIFAGHLHERWGRTGSVPGTQIPIFLSGSSDQRKFLLAEFAPGYLRVVVVDSTRGKPTFVGISGTNVYRVDF